MNAIFEIPINPFKFANTLIGVLKQLCIAAVYVLLGYASEHNFSGENIVSSFWPASGLALTAILISGGRYLLAILLGALVVNALSNNSLIWIFGATFASILEVLVGFWLLTRHHKFSTSLEALPDYLRLILLGGGLACFIGALFGALALLIADLAAPADYFGNVLSWWMGDTLGVVLVAPLILAWRQTKSEQLTGIQQAEVVLTLGLTIITGQIVFLGWFNEYLPLAPKAYSMFMFMTWISIRFGILMTTFALNLIAIQALSGAYLKVGYFANELDRAGLNNFWFFMLVLSGVAMVLSFYVRGIKLKELSLRESEALLRESQIIAGLGNYVLDIPTGLWKSSDVLDKLFGIDKSYERSIEGWSVLIHPNDRKMMIGYLKNDVIGEGKAFDKEYRIIRLKDQSERWVYGLGKLEFDAQGRPFKMHGTVQDVTDRKKYEECLRQSEEKLRAYLDNISDTIWLIDANMIVAYVSPNVAHLLGFLPEQLIGRPSSLVIHPDDMTTVIKAQLYVIKHTGKPLTIQYRVSHKDHRWIYVESTGVNMLGNPEIKGVLVSMRNISERKQAEIDLRIAATAFESQEGMIITDAQSVILRVNRAFTIITGYSAEEVIGKKPSLFQSGRHNAAFYADMWESIHRMGAWEGEIWNQRKNGEIYPEYLTITAVKDSNGIVTNYVATFNDITIHKAAADEIERLAFYDCLTHLPNRQLLRDRLITALAASHRSGRKGALLFIDMDNFKTLNDTLGHDVGDLLLQQIAQRLVSCMHEGDTVARLGGDEFVVMLEDLSKQTLDSAAQTEVFGNKILASLNQPYQLDALEYHCTPSIGATLFSGHEQSIDDLLKQGDIAMYQAKASGRNTFRFFDPQMQASINARARLEKDLRIALADNQFILYYQPQVCRDHRVIGAEALIRWQHPLRGLVSPLDFIPLAEETDLILPIGQWVLEMACTQIKTWENNGHFKHLQLSVNVSARQFRQPDFVEQVSQILRRSDINPDKLKLELTESVVLDDIDECVRKMHALREIGVRFSMDDFGAGYSSLSYLTQLPLDQLKIDQSFIFNIGVKETDAVIVQTIIGMAKNLSMDVIAEGVETEAQHAFLEQHGCPVYQGNLFSKPVPIERFESLPM